MNFETTGAKARRLVGDAVGREMAYVLGAKGFCARVWRSARAAWRCAKIAARSRAEERVQ
jgi:hypothetical protein